MTPDPGPALRSAALRVLLPSYAGTAVPSQLLALLEDGLGGVCLFGSNTADGPDAVAVATAAVRSARPGAVVAVDEEGGDVTRLHVSKGSPVLGPLALGVADDLDLTRATGRAVGLELAALGVTLDLAPVADVNFRADNPVIGTRSFGTVPGDVARHVAAWTAGLQSAGVAACAKHFPGHGDTAVDSHLGLPVLEGDAELLCSRELPPFAAVVDAGAAAVMTGHLVVPALDPHLPASLSPGAVALLRDRLGFDGLVVTDALDMAGASGGRGLPEAAVLALVAGADLLCLGAQAGPETDVDLVRAVQAAVLDAVRAGRLPEDRLLEAATRVDEVAVAPGPGAALDPGLLTAGAARSVTVDGSLPDLAGARLVRVDSAATIAVGDVTWGLGAELAVVPGETALPAGPLVIEVRDAHRQPDVLATVAAAAARTGVDDVAAVVEWGWPAARPDALPTVHARGWSRPGAAAVTDVLRGAGWRR